MLGPLPLARAEELVLPKPGMMVFLSPDFTPAHLKGITIHPENALKFDFIIQRGDGLSFPNVSVGNPEHAILRLHSS